VTSDQIISAISSFGTVAAAIATWLTIRQVVKQRRASYMPDLFVAHTCFEAHSKKHDLLSGWYSQDETKGKRKSDLTPDFPECVLQLTNIGLGAARNVTVTWSFPLEAAISEINDLAKQSNIKCLLKSEPEGIRIDLAGTWWWSQVEREQTIEYVLPASISSEKHFIKCPSDYVAVASAALYVALRPGMQWRKAETKNIRALPNLTLALEFDDIGGERYKLDYDIEFELAYADVGELHAYLKPKRKNAWRPRHDKY
jgi:hypothetical protein